MRVSLPLPLSVLLKEVAEKRGIDASGLLNRDGTWQLTAEDSETLMGAITFELTAAGLGPDSEPNSRGFQLEALLDRLNISR